MIDLQIDTAKWGRGGELDSSLRNDCVLTALARKLYPHNKRMIEKLGKLDEIGIRWRNRVEIYILNDDARPITDPDKQAELIAALLPFGVALSFK